MSKVLLISPPYTDLYGKLHKAAGKYFPLGLGYIAAYLRRYGSHNVQIFEMEAQNLAYEDMAKIIKEDNPDIVGLTSSTPNFLRAIELSKIAKSNSNAKIVLGGVHASALSEFIMENYSDCIDCVVRAEGELTMLELVNAFQNGSDIRKIKGIVYRQNGKINSNEKTNKP